jgi:hypothetical protein
MRANPIGCAHVSMITASYAMRMGSSLICRWLWESDLPGSEDSGFREPFVQSNCQDSQPRNAPTDYYQLFRESSFFPPLALEGLKCVLKLHLPPTLLVWRVPPLSTRGTGCLKHQVPNVRLNPSFLQFFY